MSRPVPAATSTLQVLRYLSSRTEPVPAARIAAAIGLPRSSTYHLLTAMAEEDFVVHYPDDRAWGIGIAAWEVGIGFARQEPLARIARVPLVQLVDRVQESAHLAILHGTDVLYVIEERARHGPHLVSDVGVRLPAHLTASGRAILATLEPAQVRALYPNRSAFVSRTGTGPSSPSELGRLLSQTRQRGYATEDGEVTPGFSSVAAPVLVGTVPASVAVTWATGTRPGVPAEAVQQAAAIIAARLRRH